MSHHITTALKSYECKEVSPDQYGNRRYVVHFLSLGLTDYPDRTPAKLRALKLTKYRGRDFAGGYVFCAYDVWHALDEKYAKLHPWEFIRAKKIRSVSSSLIGNVYTNGTDARYSEINWYNLQNRLDAYPELERHEANSACHFEDAIHGAVRLSDGKFFDIYI